MAVLTYSSRGVSCRRQDRKIWSGEHVNGAPKLGFLAWKIDKKNYRNPADERWQGRSLHEVVAGVGVDVDEDRHHTHTRALAIAPAGMVTGGRVSIDIAPVHTDDEAARTPLARSHRRRPPLIFSSSETCHLNRRSSHEH